LDRALAITHAFRYAVRRLGPYLYVDGEYLSDRDTANATMSFWSGHVSEVFAFGVTAAYIYTLRHGWSPGTFVMWTLVTAWGSSMCVMRMLSGDHFMSDVLVGSIVGSGVGLLVPALHPRRGGREPARATLVPLVGDGYSGDRAGGPVLILTRGDGASSIAPAGMSTLRS